MTNPTPSTVRSVRGAAMAGLRDASAILIGVIPFGLIFGIVAVSTGLPKLAAFLMSSIVFAGASQIAAVELIGDGAPALVVVLTAWIINLRMAMYSAAMAPHFRLEPIRRKWGLSYILTDQAFAFCMARFDSIAPQFRVAYYLGASIALWTTWQTSTAVGVFVGAGIPSGWSLDFAIPLTFLALLFPAIRGRATAAAAITAGVAALFTQDVPMHLGLIVSAILGIAVGTALGKEHQ